MFGHQRPRILLAVILAAVTLGSAFLLTAPLLAAKVVTARLTGFTGTSDQGSFEDALNAAIQNAAATSPGDRPMVWRVTRISGSSGGAKSAKRVVVTVEAHW